MGGASFTDDKMAKEMVGDEYNPAMRHTAAFKNIVDQAKKLGIMEDVVDLDKDFDKLNDGVKEFVKYINFLGDIDLLGHTEKSISDIQNEF